jgi:hypothetical protein
LRGWIVDQDSAPCRQQPVEYFDAERDPAMLRLRISPPEFTGLALGQSFVLAGPTDTLARRCARLPPSRRTIEATALTPCSTA